MSERSIRPDLSAATILFIDPHKEDREYWAQRLTIASPNSVVLQADSGAAGLAICRWQRVDCVLVELHLPDMSGFQVLIELVPRARHPEIPVIILTRLTLRPLGDLAMKNGAQAYLIKQHTSGDVLNATIYEAISKVPRGECNSSESH